MTTNPRRKRPITRQCRAHLSDGSGRRCQLSAIRGGTTCHKHGSGAPQVKAKARERLNALVEPAITALAAALERVEQNRDLSLHPQIGRYALAVLDRCGFPPRTEIDVVAQARAEVAAEGEVVARVVGGILRELGVPLDSRTRGVVRRWMERAATDDLDAEPLPKPLPAEEPASTPRGAGEEPAAGSGPQGNAPEASAAQEPIPGRPDDELEVAL